MSTDAILKMIKNEDVDVGLTAHTGDRSTAGIAAGGCEDQVALLLRLCQG